jgi:hypothetical protein
MLLAGIQAEFRTGPPIKTLGGDGFVRRIFSPEPQFSKESTKDTKGYFEFFVLFVW